MCEGEEVRGRAASWEVDQTHTPTHQVHATEWPGPFLGKGGGEVLLPHGVGVLEDAHPPMHKESIVEGLPLLVHKEVIFIIVQLV